MYMCGPTESQTKSAEFTKQNTHDCDKDILIPGMLPMTCHDLNPQDVGDKAIKIQIAKTTMTRYVPRVIEFVRRWLTDQVCTESRRPFDSLCSGI